jgi:hypothetical protein
MPKLADGRYVLTSTEQEDNIPCLLEDPLFCHFIGEAVGAQCWGASVTASSQPSIHAICVENIDRMTN